MPCSRQWDWEREDKLTLVWFPLQTFLRPLKQKWGAGRGESKCKDTFNSLRHVCHSPGSQPHLQYSDTYLHILSPLLDEGLQRVMIPRQPGKENVLGKKICLSVEQKGSKLCKSPAWGLIITPTSISYLVPPACKGLQSKQPYSALKDEVEITRDPTPFHVWQKSHHGICLWPCNPAFWGFISRKH